MFEVYYISPQNLLAFKTSFVKKPEFKVAMDYWYSLLFQHMTIMSYVRLPVNNIVGVHVRVYLVYNTEHLCVTLANDGSYSHLVLYTIIIQGLE